MRRHVTVSPGPQLRIPLRAARDSRHVHRELRYVGSFRPFLASFLGLLRPPSLHGLSGLFAPLFRRYVPACGRIPMRPQAICFVSSYVGDKCIPSPSADGVVWSRVEFLNDSWIFSIVRGRRFVGIDSARDSRIRFPLPLPNLRTTDRANCALRSEEHTS